MKDDVKSVGFLSTIADFKILKNENDFMAFCKSKKILAFKRKEESQKDNFALKRTSEQSQSNHEKPYTETKQHKAIANPSFHFYKDRAYGKTIENFSLTNNCRALFEIEGLQNEQTFELTTLYPGLLVGSGYNHPKLKENTDDFQLGFFFDHTTGLPLINGSSIKGLLRSVCEKTEFIKDEYKTTVDLGLFEDGKTIFYDAFILSTKNEGNKIFGSDYITSHFSNEENGMFKEPNPIKFLKVLPEVTFKFQFKASKEYVDVFKKIIIDFGLGAKTNVGYGKFKEATK
jgi:CRISPR-associated protein Cmr6